MKKRRCERGIALPAVNLDQEVLVRPKHPGRAALRQAVVDASTRMHALLTVGAT